MSFKKLPWMQPSDIFFKLYEDYDYISLFKDVENPFRAARYNSLVCDESSLPLCFEITARSIEDGEVMGVRHRVYPIEGVQFHPESILTSEGKKVIGNFLKWVREP